MSSSESELSASDSDLTTLWPSTGPLSCLRISVLSWLFVLLDTFQLHWRAPLDKLVPVLVFVETMTPLTEHHIFVLVVLKPHSSLSPVVIKASLLCCRALTVRLIAGDRCGWQHDRGRCGRSPPRPKLFQRHFGWATRAAIDVRAAHLSRLATKLSCQEWPQEARSKLLQGSFLSQMVTWRLLISHTGEFSWWIISYKSSWSQLHTPKVQ